MITNDYSKFKFFPTNRPIVRGKVERFKKEFKEIGWIESISILIDTKGRIIEGQHRFVACQELGMPIVFSVDKSGNDPEDLMISLNKVQDVWRLQDYVHNYAQKGVKYHTTIRDFEDKYKFGISNSIVICSETQANNTKSIRSGINKSVNPKKDDVANFILSSKQLFFYKNKNFVQAVWNLIKKATPQQTDKVLKNILSVPQQAQMTGYLIVFQNLINKNTPADKKINLI